MRLHRSFLPLLLLASSATQVMHAQSSEDTPSHYEVAEVGRGTLSSSYIPLDSWMYPAAIRLYNLGFLPTAYLGMRPWTRVSLAHMLRLSETEILREAASPEAVDIYDRLHRELAPELAADATPRIVPESVYARAMGLHGPVLNDSYHVGETVANDYGRPYQSGFNGIAGFSARATAGRFDLYVRGEQQHAPSATGYSDAVAYTLADQDRTPHVPQFGLPQGNIPAQNYFRLIEANASAHLLGHQISFGKADAWYSSAQGGSATWSNNAENIYAFRINRIEPLYVPGLSRITGLFRYDFMVGSLKGHNFPNDPWIHAEKISFKPTPDLEFGFERSVIWGGEGHSPVTIHTFLRSFFSTAGVDPSVKFSRADPGARFSSFDFTWRIPWQDHLLTVYTDSLAHDNVFPVSNPARSGLRPGIYLSRLPGLPQVDLRVEGATTNPHDPCSNAGQCLYFEAAQFQGYTNRGKIIGDWMGRESTGGEAWVTWHKRADEQFALHYRQAKAASDFIPGGTTQQNLSLDMVLRPYRDLEIKGSLGGELWRVPLIAPGTQRNLNATVQITLYSPSKLH